MTTIISVEELSKKYRISHKPKAAYGTLREEIYDAASRLSGIIIGQKKSISSEKYTKYEDFWALRDINLDVKTGERIGIIGQNGAGKSTLLKILSRITTPTKGRVRIKGRVASLLEVGTGFHPELTGRENIFLNGAIMGMSKDEIRRKFDAIVDFSEIEDFLDTPVKRFSSGMFVRLAFGVAAHLEPDIMFVDEVLAVGDADFQAKCFAKIEKLQNEGRTILIVSHNLLQVRRLTKRSIVINKGKIALDANTPVAIEKYLNEGSQATDHEQNIRIGNFEKYKSVKPLSIISISANAPNGLQTNSCLSVMIDLNASVQIPILRMGLRCYDPSGIEIFRLGTFPLSDVDILRDIYGPFRVTCKIHSLPLVGGQYHFKLIVDMPNAYKLLEIDNAVVVRVKPIKAYGGTIDIDRSRGLIAPKEIEWKLERI